MAKCLVIGASSFIGVYVVDAFLEAGYEVVVTGRNGRLKEHYERRHIEYVDFDLSNERAVTALPKDIDVVAHLAGRLPASSESHLIVGDDDAAMYIKENALSVAYLLEWASDCGIDRIISTVSYADVQNAWSIEHPITEAMGRDFCLYGDHAAYVISKNAACDLLLYYNNQHHMKNIIFRLPPVYGVGPHLSLNVNGIAKRSGIGHFIDLAKAGERITVYGDGSDCRDIVYVKDVAQAFVKAAMSEKAAGLYNIGSGVPTPLYEQAKAIADVFSLGGIVSEVELDETKSNSIVSYSMDISKAMHDFGYAPAFACFRDLMLDWKREEDRGVYGPLFQV